MIRPQTALRCLHLLACLVVVSCTDQAAPSEEPSSPRGIVLPADGENVAEDDPSPTASGADVATAPSLPLRALLIGVADYPAEAIDESGTIVPDLRGPVRDVEVMRELLLGRFRVDPAGIRTLCNADATVGGIVRAFDEHLLQEAKAGDEVLVYFSGHGSRVADAAGRERGGMDSSLVAYDSRIGGRDGELDITDDILHSLLAPLVERGCHVVVLTDACHSGGVVRGEVRVRALAEGKAAVKDASAWPFWPRGVDFVDDDDRDSRAELRGYVHLAACSPEQVAFELPVGGGWHGAFTWGMRDVLLGLESGLSWNDVASRVSARVARLPIPPQTLWVDGDQRQREVFGSRFLPVPERFELSDLGHGPTVTVSAGSLHGLEVGARLVATDESGEWTAGLEVIGVELGTAWAVWEEESVEPPVGRAVYAALASPESGRARLRVHVAAAELRGQLSDAKWAEVVEDPDSPYVVEADDGGRLVFRTLEGVPIWREPQEEDTTVEQRIASVRGAFLREARFQSLWRLADPSNRGQFSKLVVDLMAPSPDGLGEGQAPVELRERVGASERSFDVELPTYQDIDAGRVPTPVARLSVRSEDYVKPTVVGRRWTSDLFLHVLSLNEAREITALYADPDRPITQYQVDQAISRELNDLEMGAMAAESFPLDRPMLERILVIVCRTPLDLAALENRVESESLARSGTAGLPAVLEGGFGESTMRSGGPRRRDPEGWGIAWLDLFVKRRAE